MDNEDKDSQLILTTLKSKIQYLKHHNSNNNNSNHIIINESSNGFVDFLRYLMTGVLFRFLRSQFHAFEFLENITTTLPGTEALVKTAKRRFNNSNEKLIFLLKTLLNDGELVINLNSLCWNSDLITQYYLKPSLFTDQNKSEELFQILTELNDFKFKLKPESSDNLIYFKVDKELKRTQIIQNLKLSIQMLIQESIASNYIFEDSLAVNHFCLNLERLFLNGIVTNKKNKMNLLYSFVKSNFTSNLDVCNEEDERIQIKHNFEQNSKVREVTTEIGRFRIWMRRMLNEKKSASYFNFLFVVSNNTDNMSSSSSSSSNSRSSSSTTTTTTLITKSLSNGSSFIETNINSTINAYKVENFYKKTAILRSNDKLEIVLTLLEGLSSIHFSLKLEDRSLDNVNKWSSSIEAARDVKENEGGVNKKQVKERRNSSTSKKRKKKGRIISIGGGGETGEEGAEDGSNNWSSPSSDRSTSSGSVCSSPLPVLNLDREYNRKYGTSREQEDGFVFLESKSNSKSSNLRIQSTENQDKEKEQKEQKEKEKEEKEKQLKDKEEKEKEEKEKEEKERQWMREQILEEIRREEDEKQRIQQENKEKQENPNAEIYRKKDKEEEAEEEKQILKSQAIKEEETKEQPNKQNEKQEKQQVKQPKPTQETGELEEEVKQGKKEEDIDGYFASYFNKQEEEEEEEEKPRTIAEDEWKEFQQWKAKKLQKSWHKTVFSPSHSEQLIAEVKAPSTAIPKQPSKRDDEMRDKIFEETIYQEANEYLMGEGAVSTPYEVGVLGIIPVHDASVEEDIPLDTSSFKHLRIYQNLVF